MDPRPYVNRKDAKKLEAKGMAEGKDFVVPKHCTGQLRSAGIDCAVCGRRCRKRSKGWYCAPCDAYTETDVEVED